jgi:hypothetical protein
VYSKALVMGAERIRQTIRQKETFGDARFWRFDENRYDWVDIGQLTRSFFPSPIWRLARKSNGQKFVCEEAPGITTVHSLSAHS